MTIAVLALLGLVLGSFVNALVWRLHEQEAGKSKKRYSIWNGRSMCPHCHHVLAPKDLVPLLSWLALRGKCRYCSKPISPQYPLVEFLTAVLFVLSYIWWPLGLHGAGLLQFVIWLIFLVVFMALAVYDLRWFLLPDRIVWPLVALAAAEVLVVALWIHTPALLWQAGAGALIIAGLFYFIFQISAGNWIGGGDVKLGLALGLIAASPLRAVLVIFFASVYGTLYSLPLLARSKSNFTAKVPFGPFLLLSSVTIQLFGAHIVDWYTKTLL